MAAASRVRTGENITAAPNRKPVRLAGDQDAAVASPALETQAMLAEVWDAKDGFDDVAGKWSPRKTAAFLLLTCGGFWTVVGFGVLRALR